MSIFSGRRRSETDPIAEAKLENGSPRNRLQLRIPTQIHGNHGSPLHAEQRLPAKAAPFLLPPKVDRPKDVLPVPARDLQDLAFLRIAWRISLLRSTWLCKAVSTCPCPETAGLNRVTELTLTNSVSRTAAFDH